MFVQIFVPRICQFACKFVRSNNRYNRIICRVLFRYINIALEIYVTQSCTFYILHLQYTTNLFVIQSVWKFDSVETSQRETLGNYTHIRVSINFVQYSQHSRNMTKIYSLRARMFEGSCKRRWEDKLERIGPFAKGVGRRWDTSSPEMKI